MVQRIKVKGHEVSVDIAFFLNVFAVIILFSLADSQGYMDLMDAMVVITASFFAGVLFDKGENE